MLLKRDLIRGGKDSGIKSAPLSRRPSLIVTDNYDCDSKTPFQNTILNNDTFKHSTVAET